MRTFITYKLYYYCSRFENNITTVIRLNRSANIRRNRCRSYQRRWMFLKWTNWSGKQGYNKNINGWSVGQSDHIYCVRIGIYLILCYGLLDQTFQTLINMVKHWLNSAILYLYENSRPRDWSIHFIRFRPNQHQNLSSNLWVHSQWVAYTPFRGEWANFK